MSLKMIGIPGQVDQVAVNVYIAKSVFTDLSPTDFSPMRVSGRPSVQLLSTNPPLSS